MSDDELFCIDLLDKIGSDNITDEELQQALESAKANENLFNKQVASLRVYYKDLEENAEYITSLIPRQCHWFTVDDLVYLKRGGRISAEFLTFHARRRII